MPTTADEALARIRWLAGLSALEGGTCLCLCLEDSGIEYLDIHNIELEQDKDGALIRLDARLPEGAAGMSGAFDLRRKLKGMSFEQARLKILEWVRLGVVTPEEGSEMLDSITHTFESGHEL